jgi:hypothetical protein
MKLFLVDSVALVTAEMRGQLVVTGSHGGTSAAKLALAHPPAIVVFNDAGVGLDEAGIAGVALLDRHNVAAVAVSHLSARIGEAESTLATGTLTYVNACARTRGIDLPLSCRQLVERFVIGD